MDMATVLSEETPRDWPENPLAGNDSGVSIGLMRGGWEDDLYVPMRAEILRLRQAITALFEPIVHLAIEVERWDEDDIPVAERYAGLHAFAAAVVAAAGLDVDVALGGSPEEKQ